MKPADAIQAQHNAILLAIDLMQGSLDEMTGAVVRLTSESWADVAKFAHVADLAREINGRYEEWNE